MTSQKTILNIMLAKGLGGIEQSFLDYSDALEFAGYNVVNIIHPKAKIRQEVKQATVKPENIIYLSNLGSWDLRAVSNICNIINKYQPQIIITHGNRAGVFAQKSLKLLGFTNYIRSILLPKKKELAKKNLSANKNMLRKNNLSFNKDKLSNDNQALPKLYSVCHNYKYKDLLKSDYLFVLSHHMKNEIVAKCYDPSKIFIMPNIVSNIPDYKMHEFNKDNFTIGAFGRMVNKKGFDLLLEAAAILRDKNYNFTLNLGGDGEELTKLKALCKNLNLENIVNFTGWVKDKAVFFDSCDIFCLPSRHEPFGIVLLEAFAACKIVIATKTEGPSEIVKHNEAIMIKINDANAIVSAIIKIHKDQQESADMAKRAHHLVKNNYSKQVMAKKLKEILK